MADLDDPDLSGLTGPGPWPAAAWEAAFAPYDETTYRSALAHLRADDVVVDIGAGDLRFARRAAARCRQVYAIERRPDLLRRGLQGEHSPSLTVICADARALPFPPGVTVGVLLMRHCRHYREYAAKLAAAGARRLITNARWGLDVECVDLVQPRAAYAAVLGWYACACGAVGFAPGKADHWDGDPLAPASEVAACPQCAGSAAKEFV